MSLPLPPPELEAKIVALTAQGMTQVQVAKLIGVSQYVVKRVLARPGSRVLVQSLRDAIRESSAKAMTKIMPVLDEKLLAAVKAFDPSKVQARDLDGLFRAALNAEKRAASLSGENKMIVQQTSPVRVTFAAWTKLPDGEVVDAEPAQLAPPVVEDDAEDDDGAQ